MSRFDKRNLVYYLFVFIAVFLIFRFLGIIFFIIKGIIFVLFRFWYVFLILGGIWYINKKFKKDKRKETIYRIEKDDDKTIEIDDYEIK